MRCITSICCVLITVSAGASTIRIKGRVTNGQELIGTGIGPIAIRSAGWLLPNSAADASGRFQGSLACTPVHNAHGRWVDIELFAVEPSSHPQRSMFIRVPYSKEVDLGEFAWRPTHYRLRPEGLVIVTAVPRDSLIGDPYGNYLLVRPLNPEPGERIELVFGSISSGEPLVTAHTLTFKDLGTVQVDIHFAVRTDTNVFTDSWNETATPFDLGLLQAGRYRLHQEPVGGEGIRDLDFLLHADLDILVKERVEP